MIPMISHGMKKQYAEVEKETKDKVEKFKRQLKQTKCTDSLGSANINDLCIHLELKFPAKFKCLDLEKYDGKSFPYTHLKV